MNLKSKKITPTNDLPFKEDLLDRVQCANVLTDIVKNTTNGFTLSITAKWGYGKTTFVKMWEASLQNAGYKTIYFNAWESDFVADPMMALIDGMRSGMDEQDLPQEKLQFSTAFWTVATKLVQLVPQWKTIGEVAEIFHEGVKECLEDKVDLQKSLSIKKLVHDFRDQLTKSAKDIGGDKQLIVFVDELDRCRPDYAVQMLERIKHFFAINNIIFVLSIDKTVICESIKSVYGDIDTDGYLRRFVDLEFILPEANVNQFIAAQYAEHEIKSLFDAYFEANRQNYGDGTKSNRMLDTIQICFAATNHSLRDVEKYFNRLDIVGRSLNLDKVPLDIVVHILYLYMFKPDIYGKYKMLDYTIEDMWDIIQAQMKLSKLSESDQHQQYWYEDGLISVLAFYVCLQINANRKNKIIDDILTHGDCSWLPDDYQRRFQNSYTILQRVHDKQNLFKKIEFISANFNWRVKEMIST